MKAITCRFIAIWICLGAGTLAGNAGTLNLVFENDLFYKQDRDYSNGIEVSWSPDTYFEGLSAALARNLPWLSENISPQVSYSIGQLMFTPEHTRLTTPIPTERPYAGYLYGGITIRQTHGSRQDGWRMQLGMVGPSSLTADSQKFIHSIRGLEKPLGWHTQLRDEPGLIVGYERSYFQPILPRYLGDNFDVKPHFGFTVGNVFDYIDAGALVRAGFNMPPEGAPPVIQPSPSGSNHFEMQAELGAYAFAGFDVRLVGRNLFLDGNTFRSGPRVSKKSVVADFMFGGTIAFQRFQLSYVHMFRTPEYAGQPGTDQFGRVSLVVAL